MLLAGVVIFRYASGGRYRLMVDSAVRWARLVGAVGFALGLFGPMIFAPGANQGPLLGNPHHGAGWLPSGTRLGRVASIARGA